MMLSLKKVFSVVDERLVSILYSIVSMHYNLLLVGMVSGIYEQCGVLFNIASLQAQIAKSQNFESDEGIKNACKHFQVNKIIMLLGCY